MSLLRLGNEGYNGFHFDCCLSLLWLDQTTHQDENKLFVMQVQGGHDPRKRAVWLHKKVSQGPC